MMTIKEFVSTIWEFLDEINEKYADKKVILIHNRVCKAIDAYFNK